MRDFIDSESNGESAGGRARRLDSRQRQTLAMDVLSRQKSAAQVARDEGVSRKFVATQVDRARDAIDEAFDDTVGDSSSAGDDRVLFQIDVTPRFIRRCILALLLYCHSCYRGLQEFLFDVLGVKVSLGTIHNIAQKAAQQARQFNASEDLSQVRIGAHDEIFQGMRPVLVGCDVRSTYCYLLSAEEHRDAETWGVRMLELRDQGWQPQATIADGGRGLRAGQELACPGLPCRGDVFHALREFGQVLTYLENRAYGTLAACDQQERRMLKAKRKSQGHKHSKQLTLARAAAAQAIQLTDAVGLLSRWLRDDVLAVIGPPLPIRQELFDFLMSELERLVPSCPHRLGPLLKTLRNQRDQLLAFTAQLDDSLRAIAAEHSVPEYLVRELLIVLEPRTASDWQAEAVLRKRLGSKFHDVYQAVIQVTRETVRASSVVENLNSRLRHYFFLRRHLSNDYLELLRYYLNHHRFPRSERPERVGRSPHELLTGEPDRHWLDALSS